MTSAEQERTEVVSTETDETSTWQKRIEGEWHGRPGLFDAQGNHVGFERVDRAARTGRNPRTGQTVKVKATSVPKFRPGTQFKGVVSGSIKLAKVTDAATKAAAKSTASTARSAGKTAAAGPRKAAAAAKTAAKKAAKAPAKKAPAKKSTAKKAPAKKR